MNDLNIPSPSNGQIRKATPLCKQEVACNHCGMFGMCEEAGLSRDPQLLERVVSRRTAVARGADLYHQAAPFKYLYAVKSGAFAAVGEDGEGRHKILGFYFPGDTLGLDAIDSGAYCYTVVALEKGSVCRLDFERIALLGEHQAGFYRQLINEMSSRLRLERWSSLLLGAQSTEQRVAAFLLYICSHLKARGLPYLAFRLPMTRHDIANYLGMAMETVSRAFGMLQKKGVVGLQGRNTLICDLAALHENAALEHSCTGL